MANWCISQGMRWKCIFSDNRNEASFMSIVRLNREFDRQALSNRGKDWKPWNLRKRAYLLKSIDITPKCRIPHFTCVCAPAELITSVVRRKKANTMITCKEENANYTSKISISVRNMPWTSCGEILRYHNIQFLNN